MKDQHEKIKGYRDLSQAEIDLMNEIKTKGEELGDLVAKLERHVLPRGAAVENSEDFFDGRWVSIGKTHLQQGIMALVRAVARPTTF